MFGNGFWKIVSEFLWKLFRHFSGKCFGFSVGISLENIISFGIPSEIESNKRPNTIPSVLQNTTPITPLHKVAQAGYYHHEKYSENRGIL